MLRGLLLDTVTVLELSYCNEVDISLLLLVFTNMQALEVLRSTLILASNQCQQAKNQLKKVKFSNVEGLPSLNGMLLNSVASLKIERCEDIDMIQILRVFPFAVIDLTVKGEISLTEVLSKVHGEIVNNVRSVNVSLCEKCGTKDIVSNRLRQAFPLANVSISRSFQHSV